MFIKMPIETFKYSNDILNINNKVFKFKHCDLDEEVINTLVSKGAYATTLLYLNNKTVLESIDNKTIDKDMFKSYLQECKNLLKENVFTKEVSNLKPLTSIGKLEILEDNEHIFRGKSSFLVEDFRSKEKINEVAVNEELIAMDVFNNFMSSDKSFESCMKCLNKLSELEYNNVISTDLYKKYSDIIIKQRANNREDAEDKPKVRELTKEEAEGTQTTDVAPKVDQELNLVKSPKMKHIHESSLFSVKFENKFKGFVLDEEGRYTRGDYVLINECGKIKAIHKSKLNEYLENKTVDEYGNYVYDKDYISNIQAPKFIKEINDKFSKDYDYDFDWRIEDESLVFYDKNENFDFVNSNSKQYQEIEKTAQSLFGKNCYLEAQTEVIGTIANMFVK